MALQFIYSSFILHRPLEVQSDANASSNNADPIPLDPYGNYDDQLYEEGNTNDAEVGQKLLDFLVRAGEIKVKSVSPPIDSAALAQRCEQINNDRYDELIAAFNVILEEILLHGNSKSSSKNSAQASQVSTNNSNGVCNQDKTGKCNKSTDPMNRCLTPFEKELLQKIKKLTELLNVAIEKRNKNKDDDDGEEELNDNLYESPQRNRRRIHSNGDNLKCNENVSSESTSLIKKRHTGQFDEGELDGNQNLKDGENKSDSESKDTAVKENVLSKENNYGLIIQKFVENNEDEANNHDKEDVDSSNNDQNQNLGDTKKTPQRNSILMANDLRIPLRLVRTSDRQIYLVLDRQKLCHRC